MNYPDILHHGVKDGVPGSCHQLLMDAQHSLLIDCGLFQGAETSAEGKSAAERLAIESPLSTIKALVATRVHIDHVGRIPCLLAAGFKGLVLCSEPFAKLLPIVLEDAFKLGFSRDQKQVERYIKLIEQRIIALPYKTWFTRRDTQSLVCRIRLKPFWDNEAPQHVKQGRNPLASAQLLTDDGHQPHLVMVRNLTETARPTIVIAGNGICRSGRIVNYLESMLRDPRHNVLFVDYQAQGTTGRAIQAYGPRGGYADLDGQRYDIRTQIHTIGGYSAQADLKGLVNFVTRMREWPSEVRIVHGERGAKQAPAGLLEHRYQGMAKSVNTVMPR